MAVSFDIGRLESFGDNCELGFVMRRLGWEGGSLFRWASISPESLLATMRADFARLYEFADLVPIRLNMVRDTRYGTAWHSEMRAELRDGRWAYRHDEAERRVIHRQESAKRAHLLAKLRRKFEHPNPVFVIKCNAGIDPAVLEGIHYQLYRLAHSTDFTLLEMSADPARAGTVERVDRTRLRGFVTRFASHDDAEAGDDEAWREVLAQSMAQAPALQPSARATHQTSDGFDPVILPFPEAAEPRLDRTVLGDVRSGVVRLLRGNQWCRLIDDDVFRLHADRLAPAATELVWTGLHLPPGSAFRLRAACAIPESLAVRAALSVVDAQGRRIQQTKLFTSLAQTVLELDVPESLVNPLTARLVVEPTQPLQPGERAVIDVQPIHTIRTRSGASALVAAA